MEIFKSAVTTQSVSVLVQRIDNEEEKIILDPPYQRDVIWEDVNMSDFINSVITGIVPNNIIFNLDANGDYICIDGKQRLSSLKKFKSNKIPVIFETEDTVTYAYYTVLPNEDLRDNNVTYRLLTQEEKNRFNQMNMNIITYNNLSYENQVDIFNRIQHGKTLTSGEKLAAFFTGIDTTQWFSKFCSSKVNVLSKYIRISNRKEHVPHIISIMYIMSKNICQLPDKKNKEKYLKSIDKLTKIKIETNKVDKLINICYGDNILGHSTITSKLQQNIRLMTLYFVNSEFSKSLDKITDQQFKYIRSTIRKTYRDIENGFSKITVTKNNINTMESIYNVMKKYYMDLKSNNCTISDEENSTDCIEEDNDDDENISTDKEISEESEEEVKPPSKPKIKQPIKTTQKTFVKQTKTVKKPIKKQFIQVYN